MGACVSKHPADPAAGRAVVENAAFDNNAQQQHAPKQAQNKMSVPQKQQQKKKKPATKQQQQLQGAGLGLDASYSDSGGAKVQQAIAKLREEGKITAAALATLKETKQVPKELLEIAEGQLLRAIGVTRVGIMIAEQQLEEDSDLSVNNPLLHDRLKLLGALQVQLSLAKEWNIEKQIAEQDLFRLATDASKLSAAKFASKIPIVTDTGLDMRVVFGVLAMCEATSIVATEAVHYNIPVQNRSYSGKHIDPREFRDRVDEIHATATSKLDVDGVAASKTMAQLFLGFSAAKLDAMKELVPDILKDVAVYNKIFKTALATTPPATVEALRALAAAPSQLPDWKSKVKNHPGDPAPNTLEYVIVVRNRAASDSVYFYNTVHNLLATDLPEGCQAAAMPGLVKAEARFIFKSVLSYAADVKIEGLEESGEVTGVTSAGECFGRCNDIVRLTIRVETIEEALMVLQCLHRSALIFILRQKNRLDPDQDMSMIGGYRDYQLVVAFKRDAASMQAHGGPALTVAEIQINLAGFIDVKEGIAAGGGGGHLKFKKARGFNGYSPETVSYSGAPSMELAEKIQEGMLLSVKLESDGDEAVAAAMGKALASSTCRVQSFDFGGYACGAKSVCASGFYMCASLVTLNLEYCDNLTMLPESLGKCANLKSLNLVGCHGLAAPFPDLAHLLPALKATWLDGSSNASAATAAWVKRGLYATQADFDKMCKKGPPAKRTHVHLRGYDGTMLPKWLSKRDNMQSLDVGECSNLTTLPDLSHLAATLKVRNLPPHLSDWEQRGFAAYDFMTDAPTNGAETTELDFSGFNGTVLPEWLGECANLQSLDMSGRNKLITQPGTFIILGKCTNLQSLNLEACRQLTTLPDSLGECANLESLNLGGCSKLTTLPDSLGKCANLQSLNLGACYILTTLPGSLGECANLESLVLGDCRELAAPFPDLSHLLPALKVRIYNRTSAAAKAWIKRGLTASP